MADPSGPKTETVRIDLPASVPKETEGNIKQTVRIQVPVQSTPSQASVMSTAGATNDAAGIPGLTKQIPPVGETKTRLVPAPAFGSRNLVTESAPAEKNRMLVWWILLVMSAIILIIQIWTYLS